MRALLAAMLLGALALAGCSDEGAPVDDEDDPVVADTPADSGSPMPMQPMTSEVMLQNNAFSPADLTIHVGDTVRWHTMDVQQHNVVSSTPGQEFRSPDMSSLNAPMVMSDTYEHTFSSAGTVDYLCEYHSGMVATLTVLAANATA